MSVWGNDTNINFPNIGLSLENVPRGFEIFGFRIALYGICIAIGMLGGILIARWQAKRSGQDKEMYLDFALWAIPLSVVGARLYSVIFEWDYYKDDLLKIFNLRNGGLAIYGGVIVAILCAFVYSKIKKISVGLLADTGILGMLVGQICGRWGNFFNRECFGNYSNSFLAMQINVADSSLDSVFKPSVISDEVLASMYVGKERALESIMEIRNNIVTAADGFSYIQVQPTFLYELLWNLALLIILIVYWKHKKFNGEIILLYLFGYGLGRFIIEGMRTDQLFLWNTGIAVSQLLSAILVLAAAGMIVFFRLRERKRSNSGETATQTEK